VRQSLLNQSNGPRLGRKLKRKVIYTRRLTLQEERSRRQRKNHRGHRGADGIAGPETEQAIRWFQSVDKLPVTGQVDSATLKALQIG
jgi:peptidoglycan hydrolase-like protein with peptidoglycan-binding domain